MKNFILTTLIVLLMFLTTAHSSTVDSLFCEDETRFYILHVPQSYTGADAVPLVVALHGMYTSASVMEEQTSLSPKADAEGFIVVYPEARGGSKAWNAAGMPNLKDDVLFISSLLDTLQKYYKIDANRIYATGFSMGSMMCYRLAFLLSDKIAAIAPVAGPKSFTDLKAKYAVPIIHFHARNDGSVPYKTIAGVFEYWIGMNGCCTKPDTFLQNADVMGEKWSAQNNRADMVLYSTTIGGHTWPSGTNVGGTPSTAINATDLLWQFFVDHPLEKATATKIKDETNNINQYQLMQNYPNPFNPCTTINFKIEKPGFVTLAIYDVQGRLVDTLVQDFKPAGEYSVLYNAGNVASGIYFYSLKAADFFIQKKMVLVH